MAGAGAAGRGGCLWVSVTCLLLSDGAVSFDPTEAGRMTRSVDRGPGEGFLPPWAKLVHVRGPREGRGCLGDVRSFPELPFIFSAGDFYYPINT